MAVKKTNPLSDEVINMLDEKYAQGSGELRDIALGNNLARKKALTSESDLSAETDRLQKLVARLEEVQKQLQTTAKSLEKLLPRDA